MVFAEKKATTCVEVVAGVVRISVRTAPVRSSARTNPHEVLSPLMTTAQINVERVSELDSLTTMQA